MNEVKGHIHSFETCGTVDGPGIRVVVFFQGCALRCLYCHNPDTHSLNQGMVMTADQVMEEIIKYKSFMKYSKGGVTFTGGEPLLQPEFLAQLLTKCRDAGIHTAIDTSGFPEGAKVYDCLNLADMVLLDIKATESDLYFKLTHGDLQFTLKKLAYLEEHKIATWIRYVLVPGWNASDIYIHQLGNLLKDKKCVQRVQVLPLHHLGEYKWESLGVPYALKDSAVPTQAEVDRVHEILKEYHLTLG
jgi:pyruvate formate lyase activating enzyme